ncbi:phospholipid-binding protein MlaC [Nereida sp. MMG025]|uniref:MlaC/ttg2D family ABC transporter substrate-binding protein n=1 Tax=Nereida sp. MMG025 TaxID=2909981 RepID=UPI001F331320|nr:ABC transporter substrate-binding protein [Nereida sp. MMG025]MCF6444420.1 ABC transporter substrate-binding protein [Nereida sp. MMG025]
MLFSTKYSRRSVLAMAAAAGFVAASPAMALSAAQAEELVGRLVGDINKVINSGKSEGAMIRDFERIFGKYADVDAIARFALGADARSASAGQLRAYSKAFASYMAKKYGRRFREFQGGQIEVQSASKSKSFTEVKSLAILKGQRPFDVTFRVADNGRFRDMLIEGNSLARLERTEIGALLDRRKGNLDQLIRDLPTL